MVYYYYLTIMETVHQSVRGHTVQVWLLWGHAHAQPGKYLLKITICSSIKNRPQQPLH